jgi:hypothetical protein
LGLSILLGVSGMVLGVTALQTAAGLVLLSFPPLVLLLTAVFRCKLGDLGRAGRASANSQPPSPPTAPTTLAS